jgi:hypothetical protein
MGVHTPKGRRGKQERATGSTMVALKHTVGRPSFRSTRTVPPAKPATIQDAKP